MAYFHRIRHSHYIVFHSKRVCRQMEGDLFLKLAENHFLLARFNVFYSIRNICCAFDWHS